MSSCLVKGCRNGYRSTRNENIRLGIKQKCLFQIPKCTEIRKKWCHALGLQEDQLKVKGVICEDHFNTSDIIKYDVTLLPDGTKVLLERGKVRLHREAVPFNNTPVVTLAKTLAEIPNVDSKEKNQVLNVTLGECSNIRIHAYEATRPVKAGECSTQKFIEIDTGYSFEKLVKDIKCSDQLIKWTTVLNAETVDFLNWDASNFRMTMVLRVFKNLKMKLFTADKHLIKRLDVVPKSYAEILENLTELEKTTLCDGTGLKDRRPEQCLGEVDISKIQKQRGAWKRCQPCRELRKKGLSRQRELKRDAQRRLKLANRKNNRLKIKVDKLKTEIERYKKQCTETQEKCLHHRIGTLPPPIQESVRTCLASAKVKPQGRRYTRNWIHECMLLRMKNRSMYEHLRTHFILPIPCIDTLDRCIEKTNMPDGSISEFPVENLDLNSPIENSGSVLLDNITLTERIDSDKSEVSRKLERMKENTQLAEL